jgi:hypothetical protein
MQNRDGFAEWLGSVVGDAGRAAAAEFGRAAESVRHEVVDRAWFGRTAPEPTPSVFEAWAGIEPARTAPERDDALGRTMDDPAPEREPPAVEIER